MAPREVRHPSFGDGAIVGESDTAIQVRFGDGATRWISKAFPVEHLTAGTTRHSSQLSLELAGPPAEPLGSTEPTSSGAQKEGALIVTSLRRAIVEPWSGEAAIIAMRDGGSPNWRQMEWIGFYLEHLCQTILWQEIGGGRGPSYGNTTFDYRRNYVWDLKAHPAGPGELIVNDVHAFRSCLADRGYVGVVVVEGKTQYDLSGQFKVWHDQLKGGLSDYERQRIARGAASRRRKVAFEATDSYAVVFEGTEDLDAALRAGWVRDRFQAGMRNANGNPRAAKISLVPELIPRERQIR